MKKVLGITSLLSGFTQSAWAYEIVNTVGVDIPRKSEFERMIENPQFWVIAGLLVVIILVVSNKSQSNKKDGE